ncbi:MBL fold metallo-hydrolase RNA specificity domain-containing protein [Terriglobus albidus]|uniref:MBL fold metallo-hydrolase RNA specificity domain-containing protein n=1 Tax=Terriglobus albidus TaxID=1592106 RepID=UPI0021E06920|nr:MBL fold metallo-hydrolase [Terriglobus albidus]
MAIRVQFWGAARTVTGSSHHLECAGRNILLDCGLYQGRRREAREINTNFALPPEEVSAIVLSHAHIDHSGNLPGFVREGYRGPVYATPPTIDLCDPMLKDSAHVQEMDVEFIRKRARRKLSIGRDGAIEQPVDPLYSMEDAAATVGLFRPMHLHERQTLNGSSSTEGFAVTPYGAGHMLGSTCVLMEGTENGKTTRVLFSGDVGRVSLPIIKDPESAPGADYLIMESTYGNRLHQPIGPVKNKLAALIKRTVQRGGHIVMPAFAVGRSQQVVMMLHELVREKKIPEIPIYLDSPLATTVTQVFEKHTEEWDADLTTFAELTTPFAWKQMTYTQTVQESKALNQMHVPFIVISASGMCEAGRVLHHLRNSIEDPRNLILLTGYQAENTLGRRLQNREPEVRVFGEWMRLRAEVDSIGELSGHADQKELLDWMEPVTKTLKKVFLVHGEPEAQQALKAEIEKRYRLPVEIPARGDQYVLE